MRTLYWIALSSVALLNAGCPFMGWHDDDDWDDDDSGWAQPTDFEPPSIDTIQIQDWPPLGPDDPVRVSVTDDVELASIEFRFRNTATRFVSGTAASITVYGSDLGEGYGDLTIVALDDDRGSATRWVEDLLVDLSPPKITLGKTVLPAHEGELEFWVADAWVLGRVHLSVGGKTFEHEFEPGYPSTIGEAWDYSLVSFPTSQLPQGSHVAELTAFDAAGNRTSHEFDLTIDGVAPELSIVSPLPQTIVSGLFDVELLAVDDGGGPVWVELLLGGTTVATGVGPALTVELDASEFAPGPLELGAVALDEAGNESELVTVPLVVQ